MSKRKRKPVVVDEESFVDEAAYAVKPLLETFLGRECTTDELMSLNDALTQWLRDRNW